MTRGTRAVRTTFRGYRARNFAQSERRNGGSKSTSQWRLIVRTFDLRGQLTANRLYPGDVGRIIPVDAAWLPTSTKVSPGTHYIVNS